MNLTQYNAMPEGDTKLSARLAITMGWVASLRWSVTQGGLRVFVEDPNKDGWACRLFNPFADDSIPYRLIGRGVDICGACLMEGEFFAESFTNKQFHTYEKSLTHAIVQSYIAADPMGHLAKFLKGE